MSNDVIVPPNTLRPNPIPPGQSQTVKWPALDHSSCTLSRNDLAKQKLTLSPSQLAALPRIYARKSAKWLRTLAFLSANRAGFWERNGYHRHGASCQEQRCAS